MAAFRLRDLPRALAEAGLDGHDVFLALGAALLGNLLGTVLFVRPVELAGAFLGCFPLALCAVFVRHRLRTGRWRLVLLGLVPAALALLMAGA
ncbi:hypothetical protein JOF53_005249 [Crossiella equi]|uniref:Uncharacterized protein n=1 Tax=Crossiella equi TaxID=130796 RepID=A0ABS5AIG6_9PSEU|nr:hypothetical protein [Crossiella equi]MBP2476377.1 hypothetical protein [Crossiella equi]